MPRETDGSLIAPRSSSMPDLSDLFRQNMLNHVLTVVFSGGTPQEFVAGTLLKNFVRLTDKALDDYELARTEFLAYIKGRPGFGHMFRAHGHMESCIATLDRVVRHAKTIRRNRYFAGLLPKLKVLTRQNMKLVSDLRNAVEHAEGFWGQT